MGTFSFISQKCSGSALNQIKPAWLVAEQVLTFGKWADLSLCPPLIILSAQGRVTLHSSAGHSGRSYATSRPKRVMRAKCPTLI